MSFPSRGCLYRRIRNGAARHRQLEDMMGNVRCDISISLDGYVAGPEQSTENPLGIGGERLHDWVVELAVWRNAHGMADGKVNASTAVLEESLANVGAAVMGRNMFGGGPGPWDDQPWPGWWGEEPPYHYPVFVLTHHAREPLTLSDTTFTFVTDGIESAVEQARKAAGDRDVHVPGGADIVRQCLGAGLLDELELHVSPLLLGAGERPLDGVGERVRLEQVRAVEAPGVTHLKYRVDYA
jgi:dihydrofolate reductase